MSKHRARRSSGTGKKNYVWTAIRLGSSLGTTPTKFELINDADWVSGAGQPSATIIAVRGWFSIVGTGVVDSNSMQFIGIQDDDIATQPDPNTVATYVTEDIMWTGGTGKGVAAIEGQPIAHTELNIKVKRKIKAGTRLVLVAQCNVVDDMRIIGIVRCLLLKGS